MADHMTAEQLDAAVRVALFDSGIEFDDADEALLWPFFAAGMRSHGPLIEHITMPVHEFMPALRAFAARLAALPAQGVPEGWKLVPVEPTNAMLMAAVFGMSNESHPDHRGSYPKYRAGYSATLAAAPEPPHG